MKSKIVLLLTGISVSALIFSCRPAVDLTKEIASTDSLRNELEKAAADFRKIDTHHVTQARVTIQNYLQFVNANLTDTIERQEALVLSEFKMVNKNLRAFEKVRKSLADNFEHNTKQLNDLAYDLRNNSIDNRDTAMKYVLSEKEANAELIRSLQVHSKIVPGELRKFDSLKPIVETFISKINKGTIPPDLLNNTK